MKLKTKKNYLLISIFIIFLLGAVYVFAYTYINPVPDPGHGGDGVFIRINGVSKELQQAITDDDFDNCGVTGGSYSGTITRGHSGENIIVNIKGDVKNLQEAINDNSICLTEPGTSPSAFGIFDYGNTGDEVLIDIGGEKTLQQSINAGDFNICECINAASLTMYPSNELRRNGVSPTFMIVFTFAPEIATSDIDLSKGVYLYCQGCSESGGDVILPAISNTLSGSPTTVASVFDRQDFMSKVYGYGGFLLEFEGGIQTGYFQGEQILHITLFAGD